MDVDRAISALGALAQETRLQIFRALVKVGPEGLPAGAIANTLAVPAPTLSFHLQQLNYAGLITKRRASRQLIYSVSVKGMNSLMNFLTEDCCGGRPELCRPTELSALRESEANAVRGRRKPALRSKRRAAACAHRDDRIC